MCKLGRGYGQGQEDDGMHFADAVLTVHDRSFAVSAITATVTCATSLPSAS